MRIIPIYLDVIILHGNSPSPTAVKISLFWNKMIKHIRVFLGPITITLQTNHLNGTSQQNNYDIYIFSTLTHKEQCASALQ